MLRHSDLIVVKRVKGKGRGVFARRPIAQGAVIERVPLVVVPVQLIAGGLDNPELARYFFERDGRTVAIALGYGSLYNHSYAPNAVYEDDTPLSMVFTALRDIDRGEEITINYNGDPADLSPMTFRVL